MANALANVKSIRNITFELCAWGWGNVENFGPKFGHLWRTSPDISDNWESMMWNIDINDEVRFRKPGVQGPDSGWNYPDGLFVGKGGMKSIKNCYNSIRIFSSRYFYLLYVLRNVNYRIPNTFCPMVSCKSSINVGN